MIHERGLVTKNPVKKAKGNINKLVRLKAVTGAVRLHGAVLAARTTKLFGAQRVAFFWA